MGKKGKILDKLKEMQREVVNNIKKVMEDAQKSANDYGTPKDRYDSFRAQQLRKKDMFAQQFYKANELLDTLYKIDENKTCEKVEFGAVVITSQQKIVVTIGLGRFEIEKEEYFAVSPIVPIYRAMEGKRTGEYREYPLVDDSGVILWKSKYPDKLAIETERLRIGNEKSWYQEYLLKIVSDTDRVIHPEWIQYYEEIPSRTPENNYRYTFTAIDLAISERNRADCTAMVSANVYGYGKNMRIYILPNPINERLDFPSAIEKAKLLSSSLSHNEKKTRLVIEDNMYQRAFPQMLQKDRYPAEGVQSVGDKRTRLTLINPTVKAGQVLFPKEGVKILVQQLIGFGAERYDDLADAVAILVGEVLKNNPSRSFGDRTQKLIEINGWDREDRPTSLLHKRF